MSQLISIAERIKVITNIQKTAHAMQLISMSALSRISSKKKALQRYTQELEKLSQDLGLQYEAHNGQSRKSLYMIIGSQKGFCGTFNTSLFNFFKGLSKTDGASTCIAVGTYAYDFCKAQQVTVLNDIISYSLTNLIEKADRIFTLLMNLKKEYDHIVVVSNFNASIFLQRPQTTLLQLHHSGRSEARASAFTTEQPFHEIAEYIFNITLKNKIIQLLLESLQAENSARALSMDSSTRNAKKLLDQMKLEYNKLRQAKVTKELTELSSSLI